MSDADVTIQGRFTSDGTAKILNIRSDVDWMEIINYTQAATTQATGRGVRFLWQRGMAADTGIKIGKEDSLETLNMVELASGGFTLKDPSAGPEAAVTGTTITKADPPVCTAASHGYSDGDVVEIYNNTVMDQIAGTLWSIDNTSTNTFDLTWMDTNIANFTQESAFAVRRIPNPEPWKPKGAIATAITSSGTSTLVTLSITIADLGLAVGDEIRMSCPSSFGMVEIDGLAGTVTALTTATNIVTVDIDSSTFTTFGWPAATAFPNQFPQLVPFGSGTGALNALFNNGTLGMKLAAGAQSPAGSTSDVIYWKAGKSFSVDNS